MPMSDHQILMRPTLLLAAEGGRHLAQRIILIDGARLADLMIEHGVGVLTAQLITSRRLD